MARPINPGRLILATIFAPLAGALFLTLFIALPSVFDDGFLEAPFENTLFIGQIVVIVMLFFGWPTILAIGLPLHAVLCHKNMRHWASYAAVGAVAGLVPVLGFGLFAGEHIPLALLGLGLVAGALTAVAFHLIRGPHLALTETTNPTT